MKLYLIVTRNGNFVGMGINEKEAQINFTITFPSEKIRSIKVLEEKAIHIQGVGFLSDIG